jgi:hypothetical protein
VNEILGVDAGNPTVREAEHVLAELLALLDLDPDAAAVGCTHLIHEHARPHVALSLAAPGLTAARLGVLPPSYGAALAAYRSGPGDLAATAAAAAAEHAARRSGRAVYYPGAATLTGQRTVGEVLAGSAIERVAVLGAGVPDPGTVLDTRDFVRPLWREGLLTLVATPAPAGRIAPFEVPNPTPCCADHGVTR